MAKGVQVFLRLALFLMTTAVRIREILEHVGLVQESLPSNVVSSSQVLANVSNLLNIRDTELSRCGFFIRHVLCLILYHSAGLVRKTSSVFL